MCKIFAVDSVLLADDMCRSILTNEPDFINKFGFWLQLLLLWYVGASRTAVVCIPLYIKIIWWGSAKSFGG